MPHTQKMCRYLLMCQRFKKVEIIFITKEKKNGRKNYTYIQQTN